MKIGSLSVFCICTVEIPIQIYIGILGVIRSRIVLNSSFYFQRFNYYLPISNGP